MHMYNTLRVLYTQRDFHITTVVDVRLIIKTSKPRHHTVTYRRAALINSKLIIAEMKLRC